MMYIVLCTSVVRQRYYLAWKLGQYCVTLRTPPHPTPPPGGGVGVTSHARLGYMLLLLLIWYSVPEYIGGND